MRSHESEYIGELLKEIAKVINVLRDSFLNGYYRTQRMHSQTLNKNSPEPEKAKSIGFFGQ